MSESYRVNITQSALDDLLAIFDHIQQDSPDNAAKFIEQLLESIDDLEFMPGRFRLAGRSRKHGRVVHARVERPYIIYYRIHEPTRAVFILEVRHGARRQPRRFP